jgi:transcriptional regulator with XRE-family HTH domain
MVNTEDFIHRFEKILSYYGLTASAFADKIGVQRSSISHLLTGRNKPSLEFVMRVVKTFPEVNLYWLLNGKGVFPSNKKVPPTPENEQTPIKTGNTISKSIQKIIVLYTDGSFESYENMNTE